MEGYSPPPGEGRRVVVSTDGAGGEIRRAVVEGRLEAAVDQCLLDEKWSLALILAQHAGQQLYEKVKSQ